jgi:hypothetical protein
MRRAPIALLLVGLPQVLWGATYVVTNLDDSGTGSLRWAIGKANVSAVSDTITFDHALAGGTIRPATDLPALRGYYGDTLDGDVDDDGIPDFTLDGSLPGTWVNGDGLTVDRPESALGVGGPLLDLPRAPFVPGCTIEGLAIVGFPGHGIHILGTGRQHRPRMLHWRAHRRDR